MQIGNLVLTNNIITAPLAGYSDPPLREICRELGAGLCYSEMVSAMGVFKGDKKSQEFTFMTGEHPINMQIFGSEIESLVYSAKFFQDKGVDAIDLNCGCPVKKVAKQRAGVQLMRDLIKLEHILREIRKALKIPFTIKIRLGWSQDEENYLQVAQIAQNEGVDAICIHPRYGNQYFSGAADWSKLPKIRDVYQGIVIGSGDIKTVSGFYTKQAEGSVDAIMLGRVLIGNPFLISELLDNKTVNKKVIILKHFELMSDYYGLKKAVIMFRKFFFKYFKNHSKSSEIKQKINTMSSKDELLELLSLLG